LHRKAVFIGGFPSGEERPVVKPEAGGLFRDVDVDRGAGKESGCNKRQLSREHALASFGSSNSRFASEMLENEKCGSSFVLL
jgi:hypothetical protein